jgi:hypothetical protein
MPGKRALARSALITAAKEQAVINGTLRQAV